jgi:type II secretory pathway component PulM
MNELIARLSPRERAIVVVATLVALGIALHAMVVEPYLLRVAELEDAIEQHRDDLAWMRSAVASLPRGEASEDDVRIKGTLVNFINQAISRQGLSQQLSQMSPIGDDEIRMRYNGVDFNRLVGFIAQVNSSGLEIKDLRISAADSPGIVDSSLILVRR